MFEHSDTKESQTGVVTITDSSVDAVQGLVDYMYSGRVKILNEKAEEVLAIAEKYNVQNLKMICEENLSSNLSANNICHITAFADLYSADTLKNACFEFICENSKSILKSNDWETLKCSHLDLTNKILEYILSQASW